MSEINEIRSAGAVYCTTYCNMGHRLDDGKPVAHECYVLPPLALALEREGKYEEAIEVLEANKPLRRHRGWKETTNE